jgi:hypothetical protein
MILALVVIAAFAFYVMNPDERARALRPPAALLRHSLWAIATGIRGGRRLARAVCARKPWALAIYGAAALLAVLVLMHARALQTLSDVRPEIEHLIAIEDRTARAYDAAVAQFRMGAISADALARVIERAVVPELQSVGTRLRSLGHVRADHRPLLTRAEEYVRLRSESWRLRAAALEQRNMSALKSADRAERASLEAFEQMRRAL